MRALILLTLLLPSVLLGGPDSHIDCPGNTEELRVFETGDHGFEIDIPVDACSIGGGVFFSCVWFFTAPRGVYATAATLGGAHAEDFRFDGETEGRIQGAPGLLTLIWIMSTSASSPLLSSPTTSKAAT